MNHLKTWFTTLLLASTVMAQVAPTHSEAPYVKRGPLSEGAHNGRLQGSDIVSGLPVGRVAYDPQDRGDWLLYWYGGRPTLDYLKFRMDLVQREMERWQDKMPGRQIVNGLNPAAASSVAGAWRSIGPLKEPITSDRPDMDSGRLVDIVTHPTDPQILYVATAAGGVFKTTNANFGSSSPWNWTNITDTIPSTASGGSTSVGAFAMSPTDPNTLYLGMGDREGGTVGNSASDAIGFYKSTNGGTTWSSPVVLGTTTLTNGILPLTSSIVLVCGSNGLYRSSDGGATFAKITSGLTGVAVWSIQAFTASDLVCTQWNKARGLPAVNPGGIYYSSDAGLTWTIATITGLPGTPARMTVATSLASATSGWAIAGLSSGSFAKGLLKTTDKGHTWTFITAPTAQGSLFQTYTSNGQFSGDGGQSTYNQGLAVDPTDVNKVWVGANHAMYRTLDGGVSWVQMAYGYNKDTVYAHPDYHCTAWSKTGPSTLYMGNDGGLCIVRDPTRATIPRSGSSAFQASDPTFIDNRWNQGINSYQVWKFGNTAAGSPSGAKDFMVVGLQDNSTRFRVDDGSGFFSSTSFDVAAGGDGTAGNINAVNGNKALGSQPDLNIFRTLDGWNTAFYAISGIGDANGANATFVVNLVPDLSDPTGDTIYTHSTANIYKTTNYATSWTPLGVSGIDPTRSIRNIGVSKSNPSTLAAVTSGGLGFITTNGGTSWTPFGTIPNNSFSMSFVWFDTGNSQIVYTGSVAQAPTANHLWKSTNGGATWVGIDGNPGFPFGIPVEALVNDPTSPNIIYAGTDVGVYRSDDRGATWSRYGTGLPLVNVKDLYIAPDSSFLRAATFGRGVWEIAGTVAPGPTISVQPANQIVTVGQTATFSVVATGTGPLSYQWKKGSTNVGTNSSSYTTPVTVIGDNGSTYSVAVTDTAGTTNSSTATLTVNPVATGPNITTQPANVTVLAGQSATFTVVATAGAGTLSYQWKKNSVDIAGATSATYITPPTVNADTGASFTVNVTDNLGSLLSGAAVLTVTPCGGGGGGTTQILLNPGFESGPGPAWVTASSIGDFIIDAGNPASGAHTGSWYAWLDGYGTDATESLYQQVLVPGTASSATLKFWLRISTAETGTIANDTLKVQIRNASGTVLATLATYSNLDVMAYTQKTFDLTAYAGQTIRIYFEGVENSSLFTSFRLDDFELNVTEGAPATLPAITTHPATQSVSAGATVNLTVVATGTPTLYYQWRKNGVVIPTATSSTYTIASAQVGDAGAYTVQVSNCAGVVTSNTATLTVTAGSPPSITTHPASQTVLAGASTTFSVAANGGPLTFQWRRNGSNIPGATSASYNFTATLADNGAQYSVVVTNSAGNTTSNNATLTVNPKSGNLNGDGATDVLDLATFMAAYSGSGIPTPNPAADLDGDGDCDDADLALLLAGI